MDVNEVLDEVLAAAKHHSGQSGGGELAPYLREAVGYDPDSIGIALATVDGDVHGAGAWRDRFSIQSVSKVFTLALALSTSDQVWRQVGREPSGDPFNSFVLLEYENGVPRNPFINAGALAVTDHLLSTLGESSGPVLDLLRAESTSAEVAVDPAITSVEQRHRHRAAALAHVMAEYGTLRQDVDLVLDHYFRQCAITMDCAELALAGLVFARHGARRDGSRLLTASQSKQVNALLLTCGTYDAAGEFAYRVGLPAKSGVSGAILAVVPQRCTVCVWSPRLDAKGNSVAGTAALEAFTSLTGWSVF
ncbi:glutaminase [Amycolatopsis minnesotensis]|uniref:Glutaminase n=1 Tax=Amycolatopsis minnesotensis TaxID=337894 RepID=A0ABN2QG03_9PSEU